MFRHSTQVGVSRVFFTSVVFPVRNSIECNSRKIDFAQTALNTAPPTSNDTTERFKSFQSPGKNCYQTGNTSINVKG